MMLNILLIILTILANIVLIMLPKYCSSQSKDSHLSDIVFGVDEILSSALMAACMSVGLCSRFTGVVIEGCCFTIMFLEFIYKDNTQGASSK